MKYKQIKAAAHNFAHSFLSAMNYVGDDYVIGHLAAAAAAWGAPEPRVDLRTGHAKPPALLTPPVRRSLEWYVPWFGDLPRRHGVEMDRIGAAELRVSFELSALHVPGLRHRRMPFE